MELRDIFALHAMSALIVSTKVNKEDGQMTDLDYAHLAYVMADAMLRQKAALAQPAAPQEEEKVSEEA